MDKKLDVIFLATIMLISLPTSANANNTNILFNWAEQTYPHLFNPPTSNQSTEEWVYRYYTATNNYIGVSTNGGVYVMGDSFNGLTYIDTMQNLIAPLIAPPPLQGDWVQSCKSLSDEYPAYELVTVGASQNTITIVKEHFSDLDCKNPIPSTESITEGNYSLGNNYTTSEGIVAKELKIQLSILNNEPSDSIENYIYYIDGNVMYVGTIETGLNYNQVFYSQ